MKIPKDPLSDIIEGGVKGLLSEGADLIDRFVMSKEEKAKAKTEWQNLLQQHELALQEAAIKQEQLHQADRSSARQREVELTKARGGKLDIMHFVTGIVALLAFVFALIVVAFLHIPEENRELFIHILGIIEGAVLGIYTYYYGSSAGSKQKTELLAGNSPPSQGGAGGGFTQAQPDDIDETFLSERQKRKRRKLTEE